MALKRALQAAFTSLTGLRIIRHQPFGADKFADIQMVWPDMQVRTAIDVGANIGQTAVEFRKAWPNARIHCCEPASRTYAALVARINDPLTKCHQVAIGARREELTMHVPEEEGRLDISSLQGDHPSLTGRAVREERVQVIALGDLLDQEGISRADYVKVDTEGHDLQVIEGARSLFKAGRIGILDVEVGMNPENSFHVPLSQMTKVLAGLGHQLFGLYDQMHEWPTQRPILRRCNAVFIPASMAAEGSWAPFEVP